MSLWGKMGLDFRTSHILYEPESWRLWGWVRARAHLQYLLLPFPCLPSFNSLKFSGLTMRPQEFSSGEVVASSFSTHLIAPSWDLLSGSLPKASSLASPRQVVKVHLEPTKMVPRMMGHVWKRTQMCPMIFHRPIPMAVSCEKNEKWKKKPDSILSKKTWGF